MSEKLEVEIYVAMNEDGEWQMANEADDAVEGLGGVAIRVVKLTAFMRPPVIEEAEIDIPDTVGRVEVAAE